MGAGDLGPYNRVAQVGWINVIAQINRLYINHRIATISLNEYC